MTNKGVRLGRRTVNKTQEIRETANELLRQHKPPSPTAIVDILAKRKISVSTGQVCVALRGTPLSLKNHPIDCLKETTLEDLKEAKEFLQKQGSLEKAMKSLTLAASLKDK